jgi:beta-phosphoglucomutase-like phosphatase (HAD superfamily)
MNQPHHGHNPLPAAQQAEYLVIPPEGKDATSRITPTEPTTNQGSATEEYPVDKGQSPFVELLPYDPTKEEQSITENSFTALRIPPVPKFWERIDSIQLKRDLPDVKFMAWDFDQSIANMEPFHHEAFKLAAIKLIQMVDHDFSEKHPRFQSFWKLAKRGFGLQEKDTIKVFTKAIAHEFPDIARALLERQAMTLPATQSKRILTILTARDRLETNDNYLPEDDYRDVVERVRAAFKKMKDHVVSELFETNNFKIREIEGAVDLIKRGKEAGLLIGLATGSPSTVVKPILEMMGIEKLFDATVYNDDPSIQSDNERKPYPFPYIELTRRLSELSDQPLTSSQGVAFEDSLTGIRSAHRAGMHVIVRPPSLSWLFKKLLAPAGEFDGKPFPSLKAWRESTRTKRDNLISELITESEGGNAKILLLFQDVSQSSVREKQGRPNRQQLTWDEVKI